MSIPNGQPQTSTGDFSESIDALYLHVPFCVRRCAYCDFASSSVGDGFRDRIHVYARSLSRLLDEIANLGLLEHQRTAYIGGGTPTVLGEDLPRLIESVVRSAGNPRRGPSPGRFKDAVIGTEPVVARWARSGALGSDSPVAGQPLREVSFEANPDSSSSGLFEACRAAGATRVSIGVQSTDNAVLGKLGRLHDSMRALRAIEWAREAGLRVSADLMAGVPGQAKGTLERDVACLADAGVGHVSVYALEVHGSTPFGELEAQGRLDAPDEDATADLLEEAERALRARGFERYEVSNYARPGEESLHNLAYWTGVPYLGLGPSAASMVTADLYRRLRSAHGGLPDLPGDIVRVRLACTSSIDEVAGARTLADLRFEVEGLDGRQALAEDLMLAARLSDGISPTLADRARGLVGPAFDATVSELADDGLLREDGGSLRPTGRGRLLGNVLYGALWDLAGDTGTWTG